MSASPRIVPAQAADLTALVALKDECIAALRRQGIEQWDEIYPSTEMISNDIAAGSVHVIGDGSQIHGCLTLDENQDPLWQPMKWSPDGLPAVAVHRLMVHPAQQGRGLAKLLMAHAESLARQRGARSVRLDAFLANATALNFYDRLGYRRVGVSQMRKGPEMCFEKLL